MNRRILLSLIALALTLFASAFVQAQTKLQKTEPTIKVLQAKFGVFNAEGSGRPPFVEQDVVPLAPGQSYGWLIVLKRPDGKLKWREEFTLPAIPSSWGAPETEGRRTVLNQGRTTFTEREVTVENGLIANAWAVVPGDPAGLHQIRVLVEGEEVARFKFELRAP